MQQYILIIYKNKGSVMFSFLPVNYHKNSAYLLHAESHFERNHYLIHWISKYEYKKNFTMIMNIKLNYTGIRKRGAMATWVAATWPFTITLGHC